MLKDERYYRSILIQQTFVALILCDKYLVIFLGELLFYRMILNGDEYLDSR